jgi:bifunctional UDP-N-acetylglucosamine pyrophosphorylase / glucosamine-1-phosphate N-acetyltransferase
MTRTVIILAAGEGKRMRSATPKVLHPLLGRTMLGHVLAAAEPLAARRTLVVVGHGADQVGAHLAEIAPAAAPVRQQRQLGTGHAVRVALAEVPETTGSVVVLNGDLPLIRPATLDALVTGHERGATAGGLLTAVVPDPAGLGRIVRGPDGLDRIVEERDATPAERAIQEINAGAYVFDAALLRTALEKLSTDNDQGEEYLTDVVGVLRAAGHPVAALVAPDHTEALGANDRAQLAELRAVLRDRVNGEWMRTGVTLLDPATTWIDVTVTLGRDAVVQPQTRLCGATTIGEGALVGPETTLTDVTVAERASVVRVHGTGARVGAGASVGPGAVLRPGVPLGGSDTIGTSGAAETAGIGAGGMVSHLSYVGGATTGERAETGAATVTATVAAN